MIRVPWVCSTLPHITSNMKICLSASQRRGNWEIYRLKFTINLNMSVIFPVVHRWFNLPFIGLLGLDRLYEVKKSSWETFRLFLYPLRYDNRLETLFQILFIQSYSFILNMMQNQNIWRQYSILWYVCSPFTWMINISITKGHIFTRYPYNRKISLLSYCSKNATNYGKKQINKFWILEEFFVSNINWMKSLTS